jgi:hypothetical protein
MPEKDWASVQFLLAPSKARRAHIYELPPSLPGILFLLGEGMVIDVCKLEDYQLPLDKMNIRGASKTAIKP